MNISADLIDICTNSKWLSEEWYPGKKLPFFAAIFFFSKKIKKVSSYSSMTNKQQNCC